MTLPAPRRGRTHLIVNTAAIAVLIAGATLAAAEQPAAGATAAAPAAPAKKAPAKTGAAKEAPAKAGSASYSVGVSMGEQLRGSGVTPALINPQELAQGVRDAVGGKASLTDKDRENIRNLVGAVGESNHAAAVKFLAENGKKPDVVTTASGLQYKVLNAGNGESPKKTDEVTVNCVIPGWTEALGLMKPGAKWQLFVPPQLAYDMQSRPPIPPGSLLIFEVELLSVKGAGTPAPPTSSASPAPAQPATSSQPPK